METNTLKVDSDIQDKVLAIEDIKYRLKFMHEMKILNYEDITKIELIQKSKCSFKVYLNSEFDLAPLFIVTLQLILGSDYRKEICTLFNHYHMNMDYSNRLFTTKKYKNGNFIHAKIEDVTKLIKNYIGNGK